jgi:hypothetical protein
VGATTVSKTTLTRNKKTTFSIMLSIVMPSIGYAKCDIHPFLLSVIMVIVVASLGLLSVLMLIVVASLGHKCALIVIVSFKHIFLNS